MTLFTLLPFLLQILINLRPTLQQRLSLVVSLICFYKHKKVRSLLTSRDYKYLSPKSLPDIQGTFLRYNLITSLSSLSACSLTQLLNTISIYHLACFHYYSYFFHLLQKQARLREGQRITIIKQYGLLSFILLKYLLSISRAILTLDLIKELFLFLRLC